MELSVFADESDGDVLEVALLGEGERAPFLPEKASLLGEFGADVKGGEVQRFGENAGEVLGFQEDGDVVGAVDIVDGDNLLVGDITEKRDLLNSRGVKGFLATAGNL